MPELRSYQRTAVAHLQANPRAGLLLDMGLGKTAICLTALTPAHLPVLVVAPKRVAESVWDAEVALWRPDLRVAKAVGSPAERAAVLAAKDHDITVISRDNQADVLKHMHRGWKTLILDESSGYKAQGTARWKAAKRTIAYGDVEHVWELTGTPSPNGLPQLWSQMYLLDAGKRLGRTEVIFRDRYMRFVRQLPTGHNLYELREGKDKVIHEAIADICLSMKNEGLVDLPPLTWNTVEVPLPPKVKRMYDSLKDDLVLDLESLGISGWTATAETAAQLSNRLSQIAAGFLYEDRESAEVAQRRQEVAWLHTERTQAVRGIVDSAASPVIVAYRYRPELEMLRKEFGRALHLTSEKDWVAKWNAGDIPILAAHPSSIGHGLNIQHGGHHLAWMSPTWDLELWDQLNARLPRSGQKNPVVHHMLSSPGTVDDKLYAALRTKGSVQQALLDHLESPV